MEVFDIVVMGFGGLLVIAGFVLFASGKLVGTNNKVELLGVKMDVNNPSLLLMGAGIGLLLVPRLLPAPKQERPSSTYAGPSNAATRPVPQPAAQPPVASGGHERSVEEPQSTASNVAPAPDPVPLPMPSLAGRYALVSYMEDGAYYNVPAVLTVVPKNDRQYGWVAAYQAYDAFAGVQVRQSQGWFIRRGSRWLVRVTASNDPEWYDEGEVPLSLRTDGTAMELRYTYNDADIVAVWQRQ